MEKFFIHDERLGIPIPCIEESWDQFDQETQHKILFHWEMIRGQIPDRIVELEKKINELQIKLDNEADFDVCCKLNEDIAELASIINDLWIWYRLEGEISRFHLFH